MSVPIRNILVPTDFSPHAEHALLYAASLGERFGATIHLVHVTTLHSMERDDETGRFPDIEPFLDRADRAAREALDAGVAHGGEAEATVVTEIVRSVNAYEAIIDYAADRDIDIIVIAMRGRSELAYLLLGSVSERVMRYAPCPVLVVERGDRDFVDPATGAVQLKRVVMAHDLSDHAQAALRYLVDQWGPYDPELHLVHALDVELPAAYVAAGIADDVQINPRIGDKITGALEERAGEVVPPEWTVRCAVRRGKPHRVVTAYAAEVEADLLAVGTDTRHDLGERLVGGTSVRIVRHAPCPTLIC